MQKYVPKAASVHQTKRKKPPRVFMTFDYQEEKSKTKYEERRAKSEEKTKRCNERMNNEQMNNAIHCSFVRCSFFIRSLHLFVFSSLFALRSSYFVFDFSSCLEMDEGDLPPALFPASLLRRRFLLRGVRADLDGGLLLH